MSAALSETRPESASPSHAVVLQARGLSKRYGQNLALQGVDLDLRAGQVHVLFGENGAGKSTLIHMLAGAREPSAGEIRMEGFQGMFTSVAQARALGVRVVFQEFSLVPMLTVAENIALGEEPVLGSGLLAKQKAREQARRLIDTLGFDLQADSLVGELPRGKQQMVEICKALRHDPKVLILDEPTASLSEHDAASLFRLVKRLAAQGTAVVYITHRMHEIEILGDEVTVLRDGRHVATVPASTPEQRLIELMTGRTLAKIYPSINHDLGPVRLTLRDLTLRPQPGEVAVKGISLQVRAGEILGIAGLVGCGKSELAQACFGLREAVSGDMSVDGRPHEPRHPCEAIAQGLWYSPTDRKHEGLALGRSARENMALSGLMAGHLRGRWLRPRHESSVLANVSERVGFPVARLAEPVAQFSGGNQQKVLIAKGLVQHVDVFVLDEPTVGVDVGARLAIYECLARLSAQGAAIVIVSSDLPELMGMTHRMLVMRDGVLTGEFERADYDEHRILEKFF